MTESDPRSIDAREQSMAAARLSVETIALMNRLFEESGISQRELARRLGVGEARVSQLLHGGGNVRIATLARVLHALGYVARLEFDTVGPPDQIRKRRRPGRPTPDGRPAHAAV